MQLCSLFVLGAKIQVEKTVNKNFYFCQAILRPSRSCAHGTDHVCHTLDTPLTRTPSKLSIAGKAVDFTLLHHNNARSGKTYAEFSIGTHFPLV